MLATVSEMTYNAMSNQLKKVFGGSSFKSSAPLDRMVTEECVNYTQVDSSDEYSYRNINYQKIGEKRRDMDVLVIKQQNSQLINKNTSLRRELSVCKAELQESNIQLKVTHTKLLELTVKKEELLNKTVAQSHIDGFQKHIIAEAVEAQNIQLQSEGLEAEEDGTEKQNLSRPAENDVKEEEAQVLSESYSEDEVTQSDEGEKPELESEANVVQKTKRGPGTPRKTRKDSVKTAGNKDVLKPGVKVRYKVDDNWTTTELVSRGGKKSGRHQFSWNTVDSDCKKQAIDLSKDVNEWEVLTEIVECPVKELLTETYISQKQFNAPSKLHIRAKPGVRMDAAKTKRTQLSNTYRSLEDSKSSYKLIKVETGEDISQDMESYIGINDLQLEAISKGRKKWKRREKNNRNKEVCQKWKKRRKKKTQKWKRRENNQMAQHMNKEDYQKWKKRRKKNNQKTTHVCKKPWQKRKKKCMYRRWFCIPQMKSQSHQCDKKIMVDMLSRLFVECGKLVYDFNGATNTPMLKGYLNRENRVYKLSGQRKIRMDRYSGDTVKPEFKAKLMSLALTKLNNM